MTPLQCHVLYLSIPTLSYHLLVLPSGYAAGTKMQGAAEIDMHNNNIVRLLIFTLAKVRTEKYTMQ